MLQMPEEHDPQPLCLLWFALGLASWVAIIAVILFGISRLLNH